MSDLTYLLLLDHLTVFLKGHLIFDWTQDSEVETLERGRFRLLAICSWSLSLAQFILLAKS